MEPRLGETITRAHMWLVQAPGHTEQCVWDVVVMAAIAAMEMGRRHMAASRRRGADQGEASLEAGVELAERGARRAVVVVVTVGRDGLLGPFHGFAQLAVPKQGWDSVGRYHPTVLSG